MADDDEDGLSQVDQGTILMLCLSLGLAVLAAFWFACKWYRKKHKKVQTRIVRPKLKQTFSRFSQVDEELTMHHMSEYDNEILKTYSIHEPNKHAVKMEIQTTSQAAMHPQIQTSHATKTSTTDKKRPYLETDI